MSFRNLHNNNLVLCQVPSIQSGVADSQIDPNSIQKIFIVRK